MLCSRPLAWAAGTDFDPYYDDSNQLAIRIELGDEEDKELYELLIQWMRGNVASEIVPLKSQVAENMWKALSEDCSRYFCRHHGYWPDSNHGLQSHPSHRYFR